MKTPTAENKIVVVRRDMTPDYEREAKRDADRRERYVIKEHCMFDTRQHAFIGVGDICEIINNAEELADAVGLAIATLDQLEKHAPGILDAINVSSTRTAITSALSNYEKEAGQ